MKPRPGFSQISGLSRNLDLRVIFQNSSSAVAQISGLSRNLELNIFENSSSGVSQMSGLSHNLNLSIFENPSPGVLVSRMPGMQGADPVPWGLVLHRTGFRGGQRH